MPTVNSLVDIEVERFYHIFVSKNDLQMELKNLADELGASKAGFCKIDQLHGKFHPEIREIAVKLPYAISIAVALQEAVLDTLTNRPNELYKTHYRTANIQLDYISFRVAKKISEQGKRAIPIPASKVMTRYPMIAHLNHREIAHKAGLGWRGKNNLLVNPDFGARLRLTTVLTDMELTPDRIPEFDCGKCHSCAKKCPAGAIGDTTEQFDLEKCQAQVTGFSRENNFGQLICGLCLNCCPPKKRRHKTK